MTACKRFCAHAHYYLTLIFAADPMGSISSSVKSRWRFANHVTKKTEFSGDENASSYAANNTLLISSCVQFKTKQHFVSRFVEKQYEMSTRRKRTLSQLSENIVICSCLADQKILEVWVFCISQSHIGRNWTVRILCSHSFFLLSLLFHMGIHVVFFFLSRHFNLIENIYYIFSESEYAQWQSGHFCFSVTASSSCEASS